MRILYFCTSNYYAVFKNVINLFEDDVNNTSCMTNKTTCMFFDAMLARKK